MGFRNHFLSQEETDDFDFIFTQRHYKCIIKKRRILKNCNRKEKKHGKYRKRNFKEARNQL